MLDNVATTYSDTAADGTLTTISTGGTGASVQTFEVWPIPVTNGQLRFIGSVPLPRLTEDGDVAILDDMMLVLSVAADRLARYDAADAKLKISQAQQIAFRLGATLPRRQSVFSLTGNRTYTKKLRYTNIRINH